MEVRWMDDLWGEVEQKCLTHASAMLDGETTPTVATVEAVKGLVETAIKAREALYESPIGPGATIRLKGT